MDFLKLVLFLFLIRDTLSFCGSDPSGIKVTTKSAKSIHVAWDTTNINCGYTITGYKVYFNSLSPIKTFKNKDVSGAATDNVEIFPIVPTFFYNIFVMALTANGRSPNPTSINYTHPHAKPTAPPSNIHVSKKGFTSLTISWDALNVFTKNGDVKGYKIYYRGPGLAGTKSASVIGEANCQYTITGLRPNSTYQFILQAINDVGPGKYSGFIPISTLPLTTTTTFTTTTIPSITTMKRKITTTAVPQTTAVKRKRTTPKLLTSVFKKNRITTIMSSTTFRQTTIKRPINLSRILLKTTTLPRVTHTVVKMLEADKLKPGQIAGIVICCVLAVCLATVSFLLCFCENARIKIRNRCIHPMNQ